MKNDSADKMKKGVSSKQQAAEFRSTKNAIYALASFSLAREAGWKIEDDVLNVLNQAIVAWFKSGGQRTLDDLLKINAQKLSALHTRSLHRTMFDQMALLIALRSNEVGQTKAKKEAACAVVAKLGRTIKENKHLHYRLKPSNAGRDREGDAISEATLIKYWNSRESDRTDAEENAKETLFMWGITDDPEVSKQEFLNRFLGNRI